MLCDEPTGNLDRQSSEDVLKILKRRSRTSLVLVVSHNLPEAYRFADRIITLSKGFIVEDLSFRPESHVDTETLYLSNPDEMTPEQIEGVNKALAEGRIKRIQPRKELFQPSSPCPDEHGEEKKLKGHFFMPIPTMMKTINHSKWRMALFPILTGILLSLFSCLFSLYRFDASEYASTAYRQSEKTDFIMQRGALTKNGKPPSTAFYRSKTKNGKFSTTITRANITPFINSPFLCLSPIPIGLPSMGRSMPPICQACGSISLRGL